MSYGVQIVSKSERTPEKLQDTDKAVAKCLYIKLKSLWRRAIIISVWVPARIEAWMSLLRTQERFANVWYHHLLWQCPSLGYLCTKKLLLCTEVFETLFGFVWVSKVTGFLGHGPRLPEFKKSLDNILRYGVWIWGSPVWRQDLHSTISVCPFELRIFYDSMIWASSFFLYN